MTLPTISTMPSQAALSVMIVDDESPARARLRDLLSDVAAEVPNAVVAEAANGLLAIEVIALHPVDVVLADIRMPKMDGIELARHVGRMERPPAIIFVTAYESYAVQAFELNAIDYLVKPVRANRLAAALLKVRHSRPAPAQVLAQLQQGARTHLSCHERGRLLLIPVSDIIYLKKKRKKATKNYKDKFHVVKANESMYTISQKYGIRLKYLYKMNHLSPDYQIRPGAQLKVR